MREGERERESNPMIARRRSAKTPTRTSVLDRLDNAETASAKQRKTVRITEPEKEVVPVRDDGSERH